MRKNIRFLAFIMVLAFLGWSFNAQRVFVDSEIPPEIQQEEQEVVDEEQNEEQPENNLEPENEEEVIEEESIEEIVEEEVPLASGLEGQVLGANRIPKTGDNSPVILWIIIMLFSIIGFGYQEIKKTKIMSKRMN